MTEDEGAVLLDTCAIVYLAEGTLSAEVVERLVRAVRAGGVYISSVSAWELGLLSQPPRRKLQLRPDPITWFRRILARPGMKLVRLSPEAAIGASFLPEPLHSDPADRLLIATARDLGVPLVTSDRKILDYAAAGHLEAIAC